MCNRRGLGCRVYIGCTEYIIFYLFEGAFDEQRLEGRVKRLEHILAEGWD